LAQIARPAGFQPRDIWKGAYIAHEPEGAPEQVMIATGSEVGPAIEAAQALGQTRVVSMPCVERFLAQPRDYQHQLLPAGARRISVEAGRTTPWRALIGIEGLAIGIDHFGHSAPGEVLADKLGFTGPRIAERVRGWLAGG